MNILLVLLVSGLAMADVNHNLMEEQNRLLEGLEESQKKAIEYKSAGEYTLVNIPWSRSTTLGFNDTTAATISTLGNAALLVGGLYLLSGFPSALARSDPFGVQRRFGKPAPPAKMYRPRGEKEQQRRRPHQRQRGVERRGPAKVRNQAEERTLPSFSLPESNKERQFNIQRPVLPQLRPLRLPQMPSLPRLRLPSFPGLGRRPRPQQSRPAPAPQSSSEASRPAPAPQSSRPAPETQSSRPAPAPQQSRPAPAPQSSRPAPAPQSARPIPARPGPVRIQPVIPPVENSVQGGSVSLPNPRPASPSDFGSAFDTDPFQEFQSADFGNDQAFQDLIATQFGDSFDFKKLRK